jgi:hypothetical protein
MEQETEQERARLSTILEQCRVQETITSLCDYKLT